MVALKQAKRFGTEVVHSPVVEDSTTKIASTSPVDFVRRMIPCELHPRSTPSTLASRIIPAEEREGYTMEAVGAIRNNDVAALRHMFESGHSFNACNSNGEYLIHLACRRSEPETVEFLINEAKVRVNVQDNMGRTILHDVCWKSNPDTAMMSTVLKLVPSELLLAQDFRGHTPFDFARRHHWKQWIDYLSENEEFIQQQLRYQ